MQQVVMADKEEKKPVELTVACEHPGILFALCFDAEGGNLYGAGTDSAVYRVDVNTEKPVAEKAWTNHDNYVSSLVWNNGTVISGGYDRRLIWTTAETGESTRTIEDAHDGWIRDVAAFPDGSRVVSVGDDMLVKVWDAATGKPVLSCEGHAKQTPQGYATALYTVAVSPDGGTIATADRIGDVCLWNAETGKLIRRLQAPAFYTYDSAKRSRSIGGIRSVSFSPDGTQIAIAGIGAVTNVDGFVGPARVEVWDWQSGKKLFTAEDKHNAVLNHVSFHPTRPLLVAAGGGDSGGILGFWESGQGKLTCKAKPKGHLQRFLVDAENDRLFATGHGGFQIWSLQRLSPVVG
jgi:WD40 repeat protein